MSGIPTHHLVFQFPDDGGGGDPARGGGDGGMSSVLETLKHIQVSVGTINGNVRAILDTLRRIASSGRSLGGWASAARSPRSGIGVERVFHVDPRRAMVPYSPYATPSYASTGPFSPWKIQAEQMRMMGRIRRGLLLPPSAAEAARMGVVKPVPIGIDEDPVPRPQKMGFFSLHSPGFGGIPGIMGKGKNAVNIGTKYDLKTGRPIPAAPGETSGENDAPRIAERSGFSILIGSVGKVLATISMIGHAIRTIANLVKYVPSLAISMRESMGGVSIPFARMNMNVRMAEIYDRMAIANNKGVVSAFSKFTQSQLEFITMTRPMRTDLARITANIGSGLMGYGSAVSTMYHGLFSGNYWEILFGSMGVMSYLPVPGASQFGSWWRAYVGSQMQNVRNTFHSQFELDLNVMTAGRFSTSSAYTSKTANKRNWWDQRP